MKPFCHSRSGRSLRRTSSSARRSAACLLTAWNFTAQKTGRYLPGAVLEPLDQALCGRLCASLAEVFAGYELQVRSYFALPEYHPEAVRLMIEELEGAGNAGQRF